MASKSISSLLEVITLTIIFVGIKIFTISPPIIVPAAYPPAKDIATNIEVSSVFKASLTTKNHTITSIKPIIAATERFPRTVIIVLTVPRDTSIIRLKNIIIHKITIKQYPPHII